VKNLQGGRNISTGLEVGGEYVNEKRDQWKEKFKDTAWRPAHLSLWEECAVKDPKTTGGVLLGTGGKKNSWHVQMGPSSLTGENQTGSYEKKSHPCTR